MSSTCGNYVRLSQFNCATAFNNSAILKNIIWQMKDINYAIPEGSPVERHTPEYVGFTALHFAVLSRCEAAMKLLLERGSDPTLKSRDGYSPLRLAAESIGRRQRRCLDFQGQLKHPVLGMLLSAQVEAGNATNASCKNGVSHFHLACMLNHGEAVRFFLDVSGVSVDQAVNQDSPELPGYTAMHFAVRYGSFDAARLLLERGADVTIADAAGVKPLQLLVERNLELADVISTTSDEDGCAKFRGELEVNEKILDLLLDKLRLINMDLGMPELHAICARRSIEPEIIERLVERGVNVNAAMDIRSPVRPGYTALHIAAHFNIKSMLILLKYGADVAAQDLKGITPFDICVSHLKPEDVSCIIESVKSLRDISFTNGMELLDIVLMISNPMLIDGKCIQHQVTLDSPLWAGYTMLHLAVEFAQRMDSADDIKMKFAHFDLNLLTTRGKVDESSKQVVRTCFKFIDISTQNASGMTALHLAFRQHKRDLVNLLLDEIHEKGMITNPLDFGNLSHLHIMCAEGRTSIVRAYLNSFSEQINLNDAVQTGFQWYTVFSEPGYARSGSTALHLAVIFKHTEIARLLLQHGANPLSTDINGLTPLQLAMAINSLEGSMCEVLLSRMRPRNVNPISNEGLSHFHIACYTNDLPLAEELLRNGLVDLEASINCGLNYTHKDRSGAIKTREYYNCSRNFLRLAPFSGYRALHMAIEGQALETVELLLRYRADTQARNAAGLSPLQLALQHVHRDQRSKDIVIRLVKKADIEYDGLTMLHVACLLKDAAAIEKAIEAGVDIHARLALKSPIWPGSTALHLLLEGDIAWNTLEPMLEQLLRRGANVNKPNFERLTPIHLAYNKNCLPAVKLMLRSSRILENNPVDDEGLSHFHIACALGERSLVKEFLVGGLADVNCPKDFFTIADSAGFAPLHFALVRENFTVAKILLQHGADVLAEDCYGSTILHKIAREWSHPGIQIHENTVLRSIVARANINAIDIFGMTPLKLCLKNGDGFSLKFFLDNAEDIANIDPDTGCNAIHYVVSGLPISNIFDSRTVIKILMMKGCDLDQRNAEGKTPLHIAMSCDEECQKSVVDTLLSLGADINVVDSAGNTPSVYCPNSNYIRGILLSHLDLMSHYGLHLSDANKNYLNRNRNSHNRPDLTLPPYSTEWEQMHEVIFEGFRPVDLFKETFIVAYPKLARSKRHFIAVSLSNLHTRFRNLGYLLILQYRRAQARLALFKPAKVSLQLCASRAFLDFNSLPDDCSEMIIRYLTNEDLKNLVQIGK